MPRKRGDERAKGTRSNSVPGALQALADRRACARCYGLPEGTPPMLFALGDGKHSPATAKSIWEQIKAAGRRRSSEPLGSGGGGEHSRSGARVRADPSPAVLGRGRRAAGRIMAIRVFMQGAFSALA
jgi:hypothetical protein